jgi:Zn-dependent membrane protease YugP
LISLLGTLATWWPVLALLYVPWLAQELALVLAQRTRHTLDHRIPDDLPMTAGEWLVDRIARLGYPIAALVTDQEGDAYWPAARLIQLRVQTFFKADPVYWSTAAHELGHARVHVEAPVVWALRLTATRLRGGLIAAGVGLAIGRVLYALPIAGTLAFRCFAIAAGSTIFTLIDEAAASVLAYRELRASPALTAAHRRAATRMLIAAYATYLVTYVAYALLLRYWPLFERLAGDRAPAPAELTALGWGIAAVVTAGCAVKIVLRLTWMLAPAAHRDLVWRGYRWLWLGVMTWLSNVIVIWLAWDHRVDPVHAWCAMFALATSYGTWLGVIHLPLAVIHTIVARRLSAYRGPGHHRTARYLDAVAQGAELIRGGNRWLERLTKERTADPPWHDRLGALTALGFVPLLVALWLR